MAARPMDASGRRGGGSGRDSDGGAWAREGGRAEKGRSMGESESGPGGCVASSGRRGDRQRGRRWPGRVPARSGHTHASYCPRRKTTGMAAVVGWAATVEGQVSGLPGERQVVLLSLSLFLIISVFYYSINLGLY